MSQQQSGLASPQAKDPRVVYTFLGGPVGLLLTALLHRWTASRFTL